MADMIHELKDLIETNIRQRGDIGGSAKKVGLRIKELERIYGIKQGGSGYYGNQHEESSNNYKTPKIEKDIAKEIGISIASLQNYKKLTEMIPELEELVDTGITLFQIRRPQINCKQLIKPSIVDGCYINHINLCQYLLVSIFRLNLLNLQEIVFSFLYLFFLILQYQWTYKQN